MKTLVGLVTFFVILLQLAGISVVVWIGYTIYTDGLKALIDGIWLGFGG